jgi:hypothetical protein
MHVGEINRRRRPATKTSKQTAVDNENKSGSAAAVNEEEASILAKLITYAKISGNNNKGKGKEKGKRPTVVSSLTLQPQLRGGCFLFV